MEWVRCDVCGGSGVNPNYREKYCEYSGCSTKIGYHKDADHPPKYCSYHKGVVQQERTQRSQQPRHEQRPAYQQKPRQDDKWQEKPCPGLKGESGCSSRNTIRYRTDWSRIPDLCPACIAKIKEKKAENAAKWQEKPCPGLRGESGCASRSTIKYRTDWDRIPDICPDCVSKIKARKAQNDAKLFVKQDGRNFSIENNKRELLATMGPCTSSNKNGPNADKQREYASKGYWWLALAGEPHLSYIFREKPVQDGKLLSLTVSIETRGPTWFRDLVRTSAIASLAESW